MPGREETGCFLHHKQSACAIGKKKRIRISNGLYAKKHFTKRNLPARGARNAVQMPQAAPVAKKSRCSDLPVKKKRRRRKRKNVGTWERNSFFSFSFLNVSNDAMIEAVVKTRKYHLPIWFLEDSNRVPCVRLMYLSSMCWNNVAVQKANNAEMWMIGPGGRKSGVISWCFYYSKMNDWKIKKV